jgi:nucleoside-diphosphate-sugar epimerase
MTIVPAQGTRPVGTSVLVTGGTGFVGRVLVRRLLADGYAVRVLARQQSRVDGLVALGAEVVRGDVADMTSFDAAMAGCGQVIHLAAGTSGSERDCQTATLQGTKNLLELCARHRPQRLVYISSCSVYGIVDASTRTAIVETSALERSPELRGCYSASKQEAETYVARFIESGTVPTVILRPGTIYGPGGELYTPLLGFATGSQYIVIGSRRAVMPFVHVENVVGAIVLSMEKPEAVGEVFNVIDPEPLTKRDYMNRVIRRVDPGARVLYLPLGVLHGIVRMQEMVFGLMKRRPLLTRYRLTSSQKRVTYSGAKIAKRLGWTPSVSLTEGLDRLVASERLKQYGSAGTAGPSSATAENRTGDAAVRASA